jgi:hypothetical protein
MAHPCASKQATSVYVPNHCDILLDVEQMSNDHSKFYCVAVHFNSIEFYIPTNAFLYIIIY